MPISSDSWSEFDARLRGYFALQPQGRDQFVFRGQADARWPLKTTLDRYTERFGIPDRVEAGVNLLDVFQLESAGLTDAGHGLLHLLARHHGLPSTIMDWTRSPYIAAFFAYRDARHDGPGRPGDVAVWCLNLARAGQYFRDDVVPIDDSAAVREIPRAIEQRSVFIDVRFPFDWNALPQEILTCFTIPAGERRFALSQLESMGINERGLFRSLEGAAEVAAWRVRDMLGDNP